LPQNKAALLHRSGRTGRAGRKGVSVLLAPYPKRRRVEQLLASAQIEASWSGPPSADEVRERDQARLLEDPLLQEPASEEELALARKILDGRPPEQVAAALIRIQRQRLPEPEEVYDDGQGAARSESRPPRDMAREPRERREPATVGDGAWFRLAVGRQNNADPKWLIPLICRLGHVTKKDIGEIRIFDRETKFEIAGAAAERFREAAKAAAKEGDIKVEPASPAPPKGARSGPRPGPPRHGPPGASGPPPKRGKRRANG
jgi:ATP-dependent RNA helicase DeaD